MGKNTSISLSDHHLKFLNQQVDSGRYGSISEVIRDSLRLAEEKEMKVEALRAALIEGEESGFAEDFDFDDWLEERFSQK